MREHEPTVMLARSGATVYREPGESSRPTPRSWSPAVRENERFDATSMSTLVSKDVTERAVPSFQSGSIIDEWDEGDSIPTTALVAGVEPQRTVLFAGKLVITPSKLPRRLPHIIIDSDGFLDPAEE